MNVIITNIEHTADLGLRIEAEDLEEVFLEMAQELARISFEIDLVKPTGIIKFQIEAPDREALLVRYLNEVLYYFAIGFLAISFEINLISALKLDAKIYGEYYRQGVHKINHEIKRATYHSLLLYPEGDKWIGQVVFDM
jgi:SHS2 domain-containing protein